MPEKNTHTANLPEAYAALKASLEENRAILDSLFEDVDIMRHRVFENAQNPSLQFCVYFSDGVSDSVLIGEQIIKPLILAQSLPTDPQKLYQAVRNHVEFIGDMQESADMEEIVESITYGDTLLLVAGAPQGLILSSKNFVLRGVAEPEVEKVLSGPREGFNEGIMINLSMLRRRLRTHQLKLKMNSLGRQSKTAVCIAYMDNIVNRDILAELERRLETIEIDGVLDAEYISEFIAEKSALGFPTIGATERPDVVAGRLLEGRIALFTDGSPVVLTLPYLFLENFQSSEDYYTGNRYASYSRILRMLSFLGTVTVPALFIAIVAFHHEMLPAGLMLNFTAARQNVPLPAVVECFVLLLLFDILREAGVRSPGFVGQAVGFVGGIILGQAAVEAHLIAAPMVIVVAFAGITIIIVPRVATASLMARYSFLLAASILGLTGLTLAIGIFAIHVLNLQSFGVSALTSSGKLGLQSVGDSFVRAPWPKLRHRLTPLSGNKTRSKPPESPPTTGGKP